VKEKFKSGNLKEKWKIKWKNTKMVEIKGRMLNEE
jgi:hypothetical protein